MFTLRDVVHEVFACLGPLRACEETVQQYWAEPLDEYVVEPVTENCVDPVRRVLEVNPLSCIPCLGDPPSLPQNDSTAQQDARADQVARTRAQYEYDYSLVRTFRVEELPDGQKIGIQGRGIAILAKLPAAQLPSLCWVLIVLRQALVVLDNLLVVLDMIAQEPERGARRSQSAEPGLAEVASDGISRAEIQQHRADVQELRRNLVGTLLWGERTSRRARYTDGTTGNAHPWSAPAPARETRGTRDVGSRCSCIRCSPESFTRDLIEETKNALSRIVQYLLEIPALDRHPHSIRAYNELFQRIPLPEFAKWFRDDEMFALQRVAGQNPVVIQRITWNDEWRGKLPVTDEQFRSVMGEDDSLDAASSEARLYVCDYAQSLANTIAGDFPFDMQKYLYAPIALFALLRSDRNVIRAVAIQVEQGQQKPVFTPGDGWSWEMAKSIVQSADCNDSEFYRHLGRGHLLTEAFILATYRTLPRQHPLYVLLTPNFEGTLFTNATAVQSINDEETYLNITHMIFAGTVPSTLGIAGNAVASVNYTANYVPNDLKERGVDDPAAFPNYPYRDDAMLVWNAIHGWVADYVRLYYSCDEDVRGDYELQNWADEVSSPDGGRIQGVGEDGRIETVDTLVETMTAVIFVASAHHALTNFPLDDYEIYSPGWPGALYAPAPESTEGQTRRKWLRALAPLNMAMLQQALGFVIGTTYYTRLGQYPTCHFNDPRVRAPLSAYQQDLSRIEDTINARNRTRPLPYPFLLPSRVPQSTNI